MLRMGPVVGVNVITKVIVIETILPGIRGAPSGSREGEAGMIVGVVLMVGGRDGIGAGVVTDRLCMGDDGRLVGWTIDYAGTVEELSLGSITSGIVLIGGMGVGRGVEGVCGKGEIGLRRDTGGSDRMVVINWKAAETRKGDGGIV